MGTTPSSPDKSELSQQLWDIATTLTPEAQNASLKKAEELGFDLGRGRIPLAETLINLDQARSVLLDLVEKNRLGQLPLKIQYFLLAQSQRVGQNLQALISGSDTVQALEDSVDDLTSSIWQYNLQNLSGEVLGFAEKMNQLKRQETLIREVHRQAESFSSVRAKAEKILARLEELDGAAGATSAALAEATSKSDSFLAEILKDREKGTTTLAEIEAGKDFALKGVEACTLATERASGIVKETEAVKEQGIAVINELSEQLQLASNQLGENKATAEQLFRKLGEDCEKATSSLQVDAAKTSELLNQSRNCEKVPEGS